MCDLVYILGSGSLWNDQEIKFSLRSVEKHLTGFRDVYIIGTCPDFLKDVRHIYMKDSHPCKETNIYRKVLRACQEQSISDNFLFFNDDHFLLQDFYAPQFPNFYKGNLKATFITRQKRTRNRRYGMAVDNTARILLSKKLPIRDYDTHTPIIYNKQGFIDAMRNYDWEKRVSYVVKSTYGNTVGLDSPIKEPDCKLNKKMLAGEILETLQQRKVFSIGNDAIDPQLSIVMNQLYPNPSRWEK